MLKLDNSLLEELGLGSLSEAQKQAMLQHIYDTLELRVGTNLANQMTDAQLEEFERFIDDGGDANQAQALQWLETNLPNYKQVVNDVFEALKFEIKQMAPQIVASSMAQQQAIPDPVSQPAITDPMQPPTQTAVPPQMPAPSAPAPTATVAAAPSYVAPAAGYPQPVIPSPATPQSQPPVAPAPGSPTPTPYQFPAQQPPAGPGNGGPAY